MAPENDRPDINQRIDGGVGNQQAAGNIINHNYPPDTQKLTSSLSNVLPKIAASVSSSHPTQTYERPSEIQAKIDHNNLGSYKIWIDSYGQYAQDIEAIYDEIDSDKPGTKNKILGDIRAKYVEAKRQVLSATSPGLAPDKILEIVRSNSDKLVEMVAAAIKAQILASNTEPLEAEDIEPGILGVVCHAFINCRILENPPNVD